MAPAPSGTGGSGESSGAAQSSAAASALSRSPLAFGWPSPMLLVTYPLVVSNVKNLCEKDRRGKSQGLAQIISLLRKTYDVEGLQGLYRGGHLHLLHQVVRDLLRSVAESGFVLVEQRLGLRPFSQPALEDCPEAEAPASRRKRFLSRLAVKYCIDGLIYPVLLASTRVVVLKDDQESSWERLCHWCREEGVLSLFGGLAASLMSTAVEEAMEYLLAWSIDRSAQGQNVDLQDKLVLKACGGSVVSVFTSPINYVGVIQRCQSRLPRLLEPQPLWSTIWGLPWRASFNQLVLFSAILGMNVRLIQWKMELQAEEDEDAPPNYTSQREVE